MTKKQRHLVYDVEHPDVVYEIVFDPETKRITKWVVKTCQQK